MGKRAAKLVLRWLTHKPLFAQSQAVDLRLDHFAVHGNSVSDIVDQPPRFFRNLILSPIGIAPPHSSASHSRVMRRNRNPLSKRSDEDKRRNASTCTDEIRRS